MESASSRFLKKNIAAVMTVVAFASLLIVWEAVARFTMQRCFSLLHRKFCGNSSRALRYRSEGIPCWCISA